jgi:glutamine amidotransferase
LTIAIIDYGAGNLRSAAKALELAASRIGSTASVVVTADPDVVAKADHIVLPGDGAFADCRTNLDSVDGMIEAINEAIDARGRPFLGICVGMQLLATRGIEYGVTKGLGRIKGEVRRIEPNGLALLANFLEWRP